MKNNHFLFSVALAAVCFFSACKNSDKPAEANNNTTSTSKTPPEERPMSAMKPALNNNNSSTNSNNSDDNAGSQNNESNDDDHNSGAQSGGSSNNTNTNSNTKVGKQDIRIYATASSALKPSNIGNYNAQNVLDKDITTPWVEGAAGLGINEWIKLDFSKAISVKSLRLINGYNYTSNDKIGDRFAKNGRVKTARLEFSDGSSQMIQIADNNKWQTFNLANKKTQMLRLVIVSAYKGSKWEDVSISEMEIVQE
jgi:hypothetical protein